MRKWEWNGKSDCDWIVSSLFLNVIKQTPQISLSKLYAYRDFVSLLSKLSFQHPLFSEILSDPQKTLHHQF